ncbi:hypothetical protein RJ641_013386 [Dillenia turbinata]|uniref:Uncharacterized protein n=1 Tax=Dillenia turbinata TaxID=194707 RepID=A0AAN8ZQF5_9MAGN
MKRNIIALQEFQMTISLREAKLGGFIFGVGKSHTSLFFPVLLFVRKTLFFPTQPSSKITRSFYNINKAHTWKHKVDYEIIECQDYELIDISNILTTSTGNKVIKMEMKSQFYCCSLTSNGVAYVESSKLAEEEAKALDTTGYSGLPISKAVELAEEEAKALQTTGTGTGTGTGNGTRYDGTGIFGGRVEDQNLDERTKDQQLSDTPFPAHQNHCLVSGPQLYITALSQKDPKPTLLALSGPDLLWRILAPCSPLCQQALWFETLSHDRRVLLIQNLREFPFLMAPTHELHQISVPQSTDDPYFRSIFFFPLFGTSRNPLNGNIVAQFSQIAFVNSAKSSLS